MVIALTPEQNKDWCSFLYQIDKLFEYAGTQTVEIEDGNQEYVEPIFMQWSSEEIKFY